MTDNRATDLRKKLDALGIEHFDFDKGGRTQTQWEAPDGKRHFTYETSDNPAKTARLVIAWHPTPEQAIAATLGSDDEYEAKMDKLLCRLTNGKWSKSRAYSIEFMVSCIDEEYEALYSEEQFSAPVHGTLTAEQVREIIYKHGVNDGSVYSVFKGSFKAIADELNAELGSGICKPTEPARCLDGTDCPAWLCSECGELFELGANFCSNCGAKVVKR